MDVLHDRKKVYTGGLGTKMTDSTGTVRFDSNTDEKQTEPMDINKETEKDNTEN